MATFRLALAVIAVALMVAAFLYDFATGYP